MVEWSGRTTAYEHKFEGWQNKDISGILPGFQRTLVLEVQWSRCPIEVENEVRALWRFFEFGNDHHYSTSIQDLLALSEETEDEEAPSVECIVQYARESGLAEDENFSIHWWW